MNNEGIIINAKGIHKQFKQHLVLDGLDFKIPAGQIYAICGKKRFREECIPADIDRLNVPFQWEGDDFQSKYRS